MRNCEVPRSNGCRFRLLKEVLSGNYPEKDVSKMNSYNLEAFVLRLIEFTSVEAGAKTVTMIDPRNKPKWWPSDVLIKKSLRDKESMKMFRSSLIQLIVNCCDFFREYKQQWLPPYKSLVNDENFDFEVNGEKRKVKDLYCNKFNTKKRKTLLVPKNESYEVEENITVPDVCIPSYKPVESPKDEPLNQAEFLGLFSLGLNNNEIPKEIQLPNPSRLVKLHHCPHIPMSSDVGKAIIKRENYCVPEYVTARKLERLEWYINKSESKVSEPKFEISFDKSKSYANHVYKFPIRQYHQIRGDISFNNYLLKLCKPLTVVLKNEDIRTLKNKMSSSKLRLNIPKLSSEQLTKYLCKEAKVVLYKKEIHSDYAVLDKSKFHRQLKVVIVKNFSQEKGRQRRR